MPEESKTIDKEELKARLRQEATKLKIYEDSGEY